MNLFLLGWLVICEVKGVIARVILLDEALSSLSCHGARMFSNAGISLVN